MEKLVCSESPVHDPPFGILELLHLGETVMYVVGLALRMLWQYSCIFCSALP